MKQSVRHKVLYESEKSEGKFRVISKKAVKVGLSQVGLGPVSNLDNEPDLFESNEIDQSSCLWKLKLTFSV